MDIFNKNRVEELEKEVAYLERENEGLRESVEYADKHLETLLKLTADIPEDCKPGSYCKGCSFAKEYHYHNYCYNYSRAGRWLSTSYDKRLNGYICGKGEICKNFVQKEIAE